jgi:rhodanese-related sulfurtransferase
MEVEMTTKITGAELKALLDRHEPVILVEALPERHFNEAHLPGAINIPHDRVRELAPTALPDKDARIVVYCSNTPCRNSSIASAALQALGYRDVRDYEAGKQDWIEAGFRVEGAAAAQ